MKLMALSVGLALLFMVVVTAVMARDSGQWAQADPGQRQFYDGLRNSNGMQCCSNSDGFDAQWEVRSDKYFVYIEGEWREVPPKALLDTRNKYGVAKVWYTKRWSGKDGKELTFAEITCFLRGSEA